MRRRPPRTHYDNLKVARSAPPEVIRAAYRALALKWHPDRHPDSPEAARIMAIINEAYAVLSDPQRRAEHDWKIAEQERAAASMIHEQSAASTPLGPDRVPPWIVTEPLPSRPRPPRGFWDAYATDTPKPTPGPSGVPPASFSAKPIRLAIREALKDLPDIRVTLLLLVLLMGGVWALN